MNKAILQYLIEFRKHNSENYKVEYMEQKFNRASEPLANCNVSCFGQYDFFAINLNIIFKFIIQCFVF